MNRDGPPDATSDAAADAELQRTRAEVAALRRELEDTNRGLLAIYSELERSHLAEARLAAIVRASEDVMCTTDLDGIITTWGPGGSAMLGYSAGDAEGRQLTWLLGAGQGLALASLLTQARTTGHTARGELVARRAEGGLVEVAAAVVPVATGLPAVAGPAGPGRAGSVADKEGTGKVTGLAVTLRDLTDQRMAEERTWASQAEVLLLNERDRVARDLHDTVVQRLFGAGLKLQGIQSQSAAPLAVKLGAVVTLLDEVIAEVRETIFAMDTRTATGEDIVSALRPVLEEARPALGFTPRLALRGQVPPDPPPEVLADMTAVVCEALSNVARHAEATSVDVVVSCDGPALSLTVADNGVGLFTPGGPSLEHVGGQRPGLSAGNGLANMAARAHRHGGTATAQARWPRGTVVTWQVPLPPPGYYRAHDRPGQ